MEAAKAVRGLTFKHTHIPLHMEQTQLTLSRFLKYFSKIWDILNIYSYCGFKIQAMAGLKKEKKN